MFVKGNTFNLLCRGRDLLADVPDEYLPITTVARKLGISPFHFIRQFEALFGATPHQFRLRRRLERAKLLLAKGEHSVTEVCMEVGFSSLGSFSSLFARRFGLPPSVYQRRARRMIQVPELFALTLFPGCLNLMSCLPNWAFRNFREASSVDGWLESAPLREGGFCEDQAHQHHGLGPR